MYPKGFKMGLRPFGISSAKSFVCNPLNPNPNNFRVLYSEQIGRYCIVEVQYPNCTNYEGRKIIVFKNTTQDDVRRIRSLDPHFTTTNNIVARFRPTEEGMSLARKMCR